MQFTLPGSSSRLSSGVSEAPSAIFFSGGVRQVSNKLSQFFGNLWCFLLEPGRLRHNPLIVKDSLPKAVYNYRKRLSYCHAELQL
jgi:hypothetical protein